MKKFKKAVSLTVVLLFPLLVMTAVIAQGEGNRQDVENASEKGLEMRKPLKTENVKVHKKQMLSAKARAYAESLVKGKPTGTPGKGKDNPGRNEVATGILGKPLAGEAKKYAIVIGLANYAGTVNDLCVKDSKTPYSNDSLSNTELQKLCMDEDSLNMNGVLTGDYYQTGNFDYNYGYNNSDFEDFDKVYLFSDSEATYDAIIGAISDVVGNAGQDDEIVFFFSGHGATSNDVDVDGDGETMDEAIVIYDQNYDENLYVSSKSYTAGGITYANYATYYNSKYCDKSAAYIWDGQLEALFENVNTDRILFIFDTCRAGGMDDLMEGETTDSYGAGRVLVTSSTEYQSSYTYYLGGYGGYQISEGLFTHHFVKRAIRDKRADGYNALERKDSKKEDGNIAIEEAFQYAEPIVLKAMHNYQKPVLNDLFTDDLLLGYYLIP